ncbi:cell division protein FtsA [Aquibacillus koreensis]|uniref:Cell division protein FtsA n=1 Tax=Aquibacillus koreensis TaxID=279446 RepID=A0A9X3WIN7_9BACI|nr:cell division protein FtsA [Aquibacillus koreensis]MCT2535011.1 cell division protein FtsA [Aquibacillus koreensis]MDC3419298.1 cell division protein FtsA [Aquibacillus koreensis]
MSERIFALDIGTRSVVGLIIENNGSKFEVIDYYVHEHEERSMLDGQIHDIVSVANVIIKVKKALEEKHQISLTKVCVAAAGRALKTKRTTITKEIEQHPLIEKEDILFLELSAVQKAQFDLAKEELQASSTHYYCVGYSVLQYELDGQVIGSLIDQQGQKAKVEIIATFLPKVVVESLISALQRADLEMEALTLEPIAAINVLIPQSMRRLNVALVDIGAGTSDIALTESGTITAYGMVPMAGDEITEAISDHFLLDFAEAEKVKKEITTKKTSTITDILGFEQTVEYEEVVEGISSSIDSLVEAIANEIMELNNKSPKAVMLVGGGSQTPELTSRLAAKLNLPANRVAVRGVDAIPTLDKKETLPVGPEFITPIGIAIAAKQNPVQYISVTVNDRAIRLFDVKQLTVGDCLLAAGINIEKQYGRPGMAYMIKWNGRDITLPGTYGQPPKVWLNDEPITVDEHIKHGDILSVEKGKDGSEPSITIEELVGDMPSYTIFYNDTPYKLTADLFVNDNKTEKDYVVQDNDSIKVASNKTVKEFFTFIQKQDLLSKAGQYSITINGENKSISKYSSTLLLNGKDANLDGVLKEGDRITFKSGDVPTVKSILDDMEINTNYSLTIIYNHKPLRLEKQMVEVYREGNLLDLSDSVVSGNSIQLKKKEQSPFIFQDIFRYIDLDLSQIKGKIEILKNEQPATFFEELNRNDSISIQWEA